MKNFKKEVYKLPSSDGVAQLEQGACKISKEQFPSWRMMLSFERNV